MGRHEGHLQVGADLQRPVEAVEVATLTPVLFHAWHGKLHAPRHLSRIADDDLIVAACGFTQGIDDEVIQYSEVVGTLLRAGQDQRQDLIAVFRIHQDPQQVEQLLRRSHPAGEDDDAVAEADEGLQTFLDVRHDDQLIHQRVGGFGGDDRRLGHTDEAPLMVTLLCVADGGPLHRRLHGTGSAAGADVQFA